MSSELPRAERKDRYVVARARDVPDGARLLVDVGGRSVGVFNIEGRYYALLNICPHSGAELCKGEILNVVDSDGPGHWRMDATRKLIACPWHGWEYDMATGESYFNPGRTKARPYPVEVEAGAAVAQEVADGVAGAAEERSGRFVDSTTKRVKGPYTAEVLPVAVEDDYLVISLRAPAGR